MSDRAGEQRRTLDPREAATIIARALTEAGFVAYFAGGCVRDRLLGQTPKDYDVATNARPEQVRAVFPRARSVGEAFGVMLVRRGGCTIEVATFRTDGDYHDGRRPQAVTFSDAEHDARRRDFTINGLFEDPETGAIIDYVGGRADLEARTIRAIGDPAARMQEDRLRMLRAVRFAARFEFEIEEGTAATIRAGAGDLRGVSRERVGQEMRWMLTDRNRAVAAWEVQYLGLDEAVLDEPSCLLAPWRLGSLPEPADFATGLAAWLLDRHGDEGVDLEEVASRWAGALVLSGAERSALAGCLSLHRRLASGWDGLGVAGQKRLAAGADFDRAMRLLRAGNPQAFVDVRRRVEALAQSGLTPPGLITGDDLIAAGMEPGPGFKPILDAVYDAQLEGTVGSREEALELVQVLLTQLGPGRGAG